MSATLPVCGQSSECSSYLTLFQPLVFFKVTVYFFFTMLLLFVITNTIGGISLAVFGTSTPYLAQMFLYTIPATYGIPCVRSCRTPWWYVVGSLQAVFAQPARDFLCGVGGPGLYSSGSALALLRLVPQCFFSRFSSHWWDFMIPASLPVCWRYLSFRGILLLILRFLVPKTFT